MPDTVFWAPRAWIGGDWQEQVLLRAGADGRWSEVTPGVHRAPDGATILAGPLLPTLVDAHSHAFQRAFVGASERREGEVDDFWSWRDSMYRVALRITPEQLRAIAAHLYVELLRGGYTQVCEFHYLQHDRDGRPYADPLEFSWALADAAREAGIGLTLLPVLYDRAGFGEAGLRDDQRRFRNDAASAWGASWRIAASGRPLVNAGIAIHSLRAAAPQSISALLALCGDWDGPIHVHVAEQAAEVDDCLRATGLRPVSWLAQEVRLDRRWQLVHATQVSRPEIDAVARSGAGIVICPTTEANLGDGLTDVPGWLESDVPVAVGSDSQVTRAWCEELRWLEYGQRAALRRRNIAAAPERGRSSTAARLFDVVTRASAAPAGEPCWGLVPGARADGLVVDLRDPGLLGTPPGRLLDALVFSSPVGPWTDVLVAGRRVIRDGHHSGAAAIAARFEAAMESLWADPA